MSKLLNASVASSIITVEMVKAFKKFEKRQARNAKPVNEKISKINPVAEEVTTTEEINVVNETELLVDNFVETAVEELEESADEFFSENDGFTLSSIDEQIAEEEAVIYAQALLKVYGNEIVELYGEEVLARCQQDKEFCELITAHMKDKSEKLYSKTEGEIKVRLQYWNAKAQEWFWVSKKVVDGEMSDECKMIKEVLQDSSSLSFTGYSFEDLVGEEGNLIGILKKAKNGKFVNSHLSRVREMGDAFCSKILWKSFISSNEVPGSVRVVLEHPKFGPFTGWDANNAVSPEGYPVKEYAELADGIFGVLPSDKFEMDSCEYEQDDVLKDIQKDVSRRVSASAAYRIEAKAELRATKTADKAYERKVKTDLAIREAKNAEFLAANKDIIEVLNKASDMADMFGASAGIAVLKDCSFTAEQMLPVIYATKMRINKQVYFIVKNMTNYNKYQTKQEAANFDAMEVKGLINDLNSPHAETKSKALNKALGDKTLAKVVLDTAMSGHYISDKAVYFMVKKYATAA